MITKEKLEEYLNLALKKGADFAEIFYQNQKNKKYHLIDSSVDKIEINLTRGIGVRLIKNGEVYYGSINVLDDNEIKNLINTLGNNLNGCNQTEVRLSDLKTVNEGIFKKHEEYKEEEKRKLLFHIDELARSTSPLINQVENYLLEEERTVIIANSLGKYIKNNSILTRIVYEIYAKREEQLEDVFRAIGTGSGYLDLKLDDIDNLIKEDSLTAILKLDAIDIKGGEMPVVLAPGFGAVIFHEACGHGLEATSVAPGLSIFSNKLGKKIASDKVTLIDDGTIQNGWGSISYDDEGNKGTKNILIENGVLKKYLVDYKNSFKMKHEITGSGRRESYLYAPTSRMTNTYLATGNDTFDDMIKSIDYGIYAKQLSGGSVITETGDFNFKTSVAYLIENGEIKNIIKPVSLIGNGASILKEVSMVSNDLKIDDGYCGSSSGFVPVTTGQPTIKIDKIIVGGSN